MESMVVLLRVRVQGEQERVTSGGGPCLDHEHQPRQSYEGSIYNGQDTTVQLRAVGDRPDMVTR